eukprot:9061474-Pyramimonas_sp.AAC.1
MGHRPGGYRDAPRAPARRLRVAAGAPSHLWSLLRGGGAGLHHGRGALPRGHARADGRKRPSVQSA